LSFVHLAVQAKVRRDRANAPAYRVELGVEQAIGIETALFERLAGDQGIVQLLAAHVREQVLALQHGVAGSLFR
jgi:hypothetical protein